MIYAIVYTLLVCGLLALVYWAVAALGTPEPLARVVRVGAIVIAIIVVVLIWLNLFGMAPITPPPLT
jgi:hypothetical protein